MEDHYVNYWAIGNNVLRPLEIRFSSSSSSSSSHIMHIIIEFPSKLRYCDGTA